jgi:hypothetical protein
MPMVSTPAPRRRRTAASSRDAASSSRMTPGWGLLEPHTASVAGELPAFQGSDNRVAIANRAACGVHEISPTLHFREEARLVITLYVLHSVATHPAGHIWGGACSDTIAFQAARSRVLLGGRDQEFMQYLNSRWKRNASSEAMRLGQARTPSMSDRRLRLSSIRRAMSP